MMIAAITANGPFADTCSVQRSWRTTSSQFLKRVCRSCIITRSRTSRHSSATRRHVIGYRAGGSALEERVVRPSVCYIVTSNMDSSL